MWIWCSTAVCVPGPGPTTVDITEPYWRVIKEGRHPGEERSQKDCKLHRTTAIFWYPVTVSVPCEGLSPGLLKIDPIVNVMESDSY